MAQETGPKNFGTFEKQAPGSNQSRATLVGGESPHHCANQILPNDCNGFNLLEETNFSGEPKAFITLQMFVQILSLHILMTAGVMHFRRPNQVGNTTDTSIRISFVHLFSRLYHFFSFERPLFRGR